MRGRLTILKKTLWWIAMRRPKLDKKVAPSLYEWAGGRDAIERWINEFYSQPGADADPDAPMPEWGWGEVGGPYEPNA